MIVDPQDIVAVRGLLTSLRARHVTDPDTKERIDSALLSLPEPPNTHGEPPKIQTYLGKIWAWHPSEGRAVPFGVKVDAPSEEAALHAFSVMQQWCVRTAKKCGMPPPRNWMVGLDVSVDGIAA